MIYLSRMDDDRQHTASNNHISLSNPDNTNHKNNPSTNPSTSPRQQLNSPAKVHHHPMANDHAQQANANTLKRHCAESMYQLSCGENNEMTMLNEGVIDTIISLLKVDDVAIQLFCSATLINLATTADTRAKMVEEGALGATLELANTADADTKHNCAVILLRFSCSEQFHLRMVHDGCIQVLMQILASSSDRTKEVCMKGLVNLAAVPKTSGVSTMSETLLSTIIHLAKTSPSFDTTKACARGLLNLSIHAHTRVSMVGDGAILALCILCASCTQSSGNSSDIYGEKKLGDSEDSQALLNSQLVQQERVLHYLDVMTQVSCIVCNLVAVRANQSSMVKSGALSILNDLLRVKLPKDFETADENENSMMMMMHHQSVEQIYENSALALSYLSCNAELTPKIVKAGFAPKLCSLLRSSSSRDQRRKTTQIVTLSLSNLSSLVENRVLMVYPKRKEEGHQESSGSGSSSSSDDDIVQPLIRLMKKSADLVVKQDCVLCLCNLMSHPDTYEHMVAQGVVPAVISLSDSTDEHIQRICALAILNLSADVKLHEKIIEQGVVSTLVNLTALPFGTIRATGIKALYNLSEVYTSNASILCYEGTVATIAMILCEHPQGISSKPTKGKDTTSTLCNTTMEQCAAILCNLSNFEKGRQGMLESGVMDALVHAAKCRQVTPKTKAYVAGTLCNLSTVAMTSPVYFPTLVSLATTSREDSVTSYRCALALATISCSSCIKGGRAHMAQVQKKLKLNLPSCLNACMRTGYHATQVQAAIALSQLAQDPTSPWTSKSVADFIVIALLRIHAQETKEICAHVLLHLLSHVRQRESMLKEGVLYALMKLAKTEDPKVGVVRELCIRAISNLTTVVVVVSPATRSSSTSSIPNDDDTTSTSTSSSPRLMEFILQNEMMRDVVSLYDPDTTKALALQRLFARICANLSHVNPHMCSFQLVKDGIFQMVQHLSQVNDFEIHQSLVIICYNLTASREAMSELLLLNRKQQPTSSETDDTEPPIIPSQLDFVTILQQLSRSSDRELLTLVAASVYRLTCQLAVLRGPLARAREPLAEILMTLFQVRGTGSDRILSLSARALYNLSLFPEHPFAFVEKHGVKVLGKVLLASGNNNNYGGGGALKANANTSEKSPSSTPPLASGSLDVEIMTLVSGLICAFAQLKGVEEQLVLDDGIVRHLVLMAHSTSKRSYIQPTAILKALMHLSTCAEVHGRMLIDGAMEILVLLACEENPSSSRLCRVHDDETLIRLTTVTLRNLTTSVFDRAKIVSQKGALRFMLSLTKQSTKQEPPSQVTNMAVICYNISCYARSRHQMIQLGGVKLLIDLAESFSNSKHLSRDSAASHLCAMTLDHLSRSTSSEEQPGCPFTMERGLVSSITELVHLSERELTSAKAEAEKILENDTDMMKHRREDQDEELLHWVSTSPRERPTSPTLLCPTSNQHQQAVVDNIMQKDACGGSTTKSRSVKSSNPWQVKEMVPAKMPPFSSLVSEEEKEQHKDSSSSSTAAATPPRTCVYDLVLGESVPIEDQGEKYKTLHPLAEPTTNLSVEEETLSLPRVATPTRKDHTSSFEGGAMKSIRDHAQQDIITSGSPHKSPSKTKARSVKPLPSNF